MPSLTSLTLELSLQKKQLINCKLASSPFDNNIFWNHTTCREQILFKIRQHLKRSERTNPDEQERGRNGFMRPKMR